MVYNQYSEYAYTGDSETVKNRVANNPYDTSTAENISFPNAYDIFVNKENTTIGAFAVEETHYPTQIVGTIVFLDHRVATDDLGGYTEPSLTAAGGGTIQAGSYNIHDSSIEFSVNPTEEFKISYTARGDKVWDSHVNSMQNALMRMQTTMGLRANDPLQTGLLTLPIVTTLDPDNQNHIDLIRQTSLANVVMLGHLDADLKIGSTSNAGINTYNNNGYVITIGNPTAGGARDRIVIDSNDLFVNGTHGASSLVYSSNTGDYVGFSGSTDFASQVTIGQAHGGAGDYNDTVSSEHSDFYTGAMLRVHGSVYFGDSMSGNGGITFVLTTGEAVDIIGGTLNVDSMTVNDAMNVYGTAGFSNHVNVESPGYFETNNDIVLTDKFAYSPTKIDSLDPSYAEAAINSPAQFPGTIGTPVFKSPFDEDWSNPYPYGAKTDHLYGHVMYPMIGSWMFTGSCNFDKASLYSEKNIVLANTVMRAAQTIPGFVGDYFSYSQALFNPGDTYLEIDNGGSDSFAYPVYWHEALTGSATSPGGGPMWAATGFNLHVIADDNALETSIAGSRYRIFQPDNAPMDFLNSDLTAGDFSNTTAPSVRFGVESASYYGGSTQNQLDLKTYAAHIGPSAGASPYPIYKRVKNNTILTASLLESLQRNIDHAQISSWAAGYSDPRVASYIPLYATAYIYASSNYTMGTLDEQIHLVASPSPYGVARENVWGDGLHMNPGQWVPIGEVLASTENGTTWTHVETVGYRANGKYDSCWIPLIKMTMTPQVGDAGGTANPWSATPEDLGRCLPFWLQVSEVDQYYNGESSDGFGEGDYNFYVEHNLGPVRSVTDVDLKVFSSFMHQPSGMADGGVTYLSSTGNWQSHYQQSASSAQNWNGFNVPYSQYHEYANGQQEDGNPWLRETRGYLREVKNASLAAFNSRYARVCIENSDYLLLGQNDDKAQHIRVVLQRVR